MCCSFVGLDNKLWFIVYSWCCQSLLQSINIRVYTKGNEDTQPFITPPLPPVFSRFISARLFSAPQVGNEVKRTPLGGCYWDPRNRNWWIQEGSNRGIFGRFSSTVRPRKSLYICQWSLFWIKKRYVSSSRVFEFKKKISPKNLDRTVYSMYSIPYMYSCILILRGPCNKLHLLLKNQKNQLDVTWYFIVLLIGSTCFEHYYAHHQELVTMMLCTKLIVSFLVCCMLEVRCS